MRRAQLSLLAACLTAASIVSSASAQFPIPNQGFGRPPRGRQPVSPYLNLRRGGLGALNYYNLVRPQLETTQGLQSLQNQITRQSAENRLILGADPSIRRTGLRARFFNYSHYYQFRRSWRNGSGGGGVASSSSRSQQQ